MMKRKRVKTKRGGRGDKAGKGRPRRGKRPDRGDEARQQDDRAKGSAKEPLRLERPKLPRVELRANRNGVHPWVFRRMLRTSEQELKPGILVDAYGRDRRFVGKGFYNPNSEIALRLLSEDPATVINENWFRKTIKHAVDFRHKVLHLQDKCNAYRLIHSEGDGLSGLVVDRFGRTLVVEVHCAGMYRYLDWVTAGLRAQFPDASVLVRADRRTQRHEGMEMPEVAPPKGGERVVIKENAVKFQVDLRTGHKTGFFVDQRDNRVRVAELCKGQDVFDGCCYTGGFALYAARAGARQVEAVDLDEAAIETAEKNRSLNGIGDAVRFQHANVFDVLRAHRAADHVFSRIVLDPSKQAIRKEEVPKALTAYADMNRLAMDCLKPGGILVSCSCTGLVSEEEFLMALRAAAAEAGVEYQVFSITGPGPDHPHAVRVPEGRYLKVVYGRCSPLP